MNDPWDVKSVRLSGQYVSCMKLNGVPLLPPVLSKECRKEMQYYKLLAREVEKRISALQTYLESDSESGEDKTDAPDLPESEQSYELPQEDIQAGFNINIDKITAITSEAVHETSHVSPNHKTSDVFKDFSSSTSTVEKEKSPAKLVIDLSLSINETGRNVLETISRTPSVTPPLDLPERDCNCSKKPEKQLLTDLETINNHKKREEDKAEIVTIRHSIKMDTYPECLLSQDGPSSLTTKSFTGSLNNIHTESNKESQIVSALQRQRSYTLLYPSPQLLAHLEVQSLNTGIEMSCISMSESLSNISTPSKKRRSWDLESAKVKWSSMALELKEKNLVKTMNSSGANKNASVTPNAKKNNPITNRARSVTVERNRRSSLTNKTLPRSEPLQKTKKLSSPVRNIPSNRTIVMEPAASRHITPKPDSLELQNAPPTTESEDPAARVRELYEKIQKQQLHQMASLVEKQKREQLLLQQVFEEQNNILYKQLKTICPKSPIEVKEAWVDKNQDGDRGPVSLSQLINHKSPDSGKYDSPVSTTLTDTNKYINQCEDVLKKSRDISSGIKKQQISKSRSLNPNKIQSPRSHAGTATRSHSPTPRNASRKLNYDTSASDREYEPILTDRTNDTMADLNVTFPTDNSDDCSSLNDHHSVLNHLCGKQVTVLHTHPPQAPSTHRSNNSSVKSMEKTLQNSINNVQRYKPTIVNYQPTVAERAAATKIVAHAKGFLVRRLMRTERVQGTVQTIKDALLCALQLHQDREGIRGADVDLHRRLIQQITAACYSLHDTFVASTPAERCAMIAADRGRRRSLAARQPPKPFRQTDLMSQSHSGVFPVRAKRAPAAASLMTQSNYETFSGDKCAGARYLPSPRRRPWR